MPAGGKLYETESGQLFHAGKIAICLVGLPARGKTHLSVSLCRYLSWLGLSCKAFHLGDYRRKWLQGEEAPDDYFFFEDHADIKDSTRSLRSKVAADCMKDMLTFLDKTKSNGQIVIYDAINASLAIRRQVMQDFKENNIQCLFIESVCWDEKIIQDNVRDVKLSSPDYAGWDRQKAVEHYLRRIQMKIPVYQEMTREKEEDLSYVKLININERMIVNKGTSVGGKGGAGGNFGYVGSRIVFFLMNLHVKPRTLYFARAGKSADRSYKSDAPLAPEGHVYAKKLADTLMQRRRELRRQAKEEGGSNASSVNGDVTPTQSGTATPIEQQHRSLSVWVSPRQRTVDTAEYLAAAGCVVRRRPQLQAINPGVYDTLTLDQIRERYPGEAEKHEADPFAHRFPRAESYHDVAIRLEPVIVEIEREENDLIVIAHESVLRVLYGYFMGLESSQIPELSMPRNTLFEVRPSSYNCLQQLIPIPGVEPED
ncbi:6-phosphofructo-2-kinase-domain-containing protein [Protomyces lactucae-debilis]|uniref:6-phosphofructo-2-kinase n=1 Tax=Protomyces lactucae-debilis TaxID=2754530 RepID=A0A1Y2FNH5_PROLT|nr:6-phosphofructo-2-kinase-domain-containing protein [Protomyces lactucae-debilis]ORY85518.1 6-phosphofructo-2-kinase-domain-containing protein [Protomyces lactucae-debilis]